ncbi:MAG: zinc ribbon domain-containing protein [Christensenellaceae bacterium]|jgi:hypothetical protein|nr:zinc ribbon domain-containing protein [Christensenellaceae bacterium]
MAKCFYCGESVQVGTNFCNKCGKPIPRPKLSPTEIAIEAARAEYEKSAVVNIDRSKLTYVCELCDTVNSIDAPRCVECGKPRPRPDFVKALRKLRDSKKQQPISASVENAPQQPDVDNLKVYRFEPGNSGGDTLASNAQVVTRPVLQQLIIVPYVNPAQNLWQYNPNIAYRYEAQTPQSFEPSEIPQPPSQKNEPEDEIPVSNTAAPATPVKIGTNRFVALLLALLSAGVVAILLLLNIAKFDSGFKGIEVFKLVTTAKDLKLLTPIGYCASALFAIFIFLIAFIRIISKKPRSKSLLVLFSFLELLSVICVLAGLTQYVEVSEIFKNIEIPGYALAGCSVLIFSISLAIKGKSSLNKLVA